MRLQELELKSIYGGGIKYFLSRVAFEVFQMMKFYLRFRLPRIR